MDEVGQARRARRTWRPGPITAMAAGAPWLWFLVRGWWVGFDLVAIALPVLALGAALALLLVAVAFPTARAAAGVTCASVTLAAASAIVAPWVPQRGTAGNHQCTVKRIYNR